MSRPSSTTRPLSACRCPVIRLKSVDLPAPLGPMTAAICRVLTVRLTSETARKPAKDFDRPEISSTAAPSRPGPQADDPADDAAGQREQQHQQDRAEDERPVFGVGGYRLIEPDQGGGADRRSPEEPH